MRRLAGIACLALLGCAPTVIWRGRSPDRSTSVIVTEDGARLRLAIVASSTPPVGIDGAAARTYDTIAFDRLAWSPRGVFAPASRDGAWWMIDGPDERGPFIAIGEVIVSGDHTAFVAQGPAGWVAHVDDHEGSAFDAIVEGLLLDPEHGSVAYVVSRGGHEHAVHDDAIGPACEVVALETLGGKGRMLAYVDRGARDRLLVDHVEQAIFDRVLELVVASDEPHWAALVSVGDASVLVREGVILATAPFLTHLRVSDDGAHVACLSPAADGASIDLLVDGAHIAHHRRIDGERLAFVPGDDRVVFVSEDSQGMRVTLDGTDGERYEAIEGPVFAPRRAGWIGRRHEQSEIVIEGTLIATEEWAGSLALARDADRYAYVARTNGERFVVTPRGRWPMPRLFVDTLVLGDDGLHWAAVVPDMAARRLEVWVDGERSVVLDDHELGGAIAIDEGRTLRQVVREVVEGELARVTASTSADHR